MGSFGLMDTKCQFCKMKEVVWKDGWWWRLHNNVNIVKATELYT